jgi:hypothetical protein
MEEGTYHTASHDTTSHAGWHAARDKLRLCRVRKSCALLQASAAKNTSELHVAHLYVIMTIGRLRLAQYQWR